MNYMTALRENLPKAPDWAASAHPNRDHEGFVLNEWEHNGREDSDWYVAVWLPSEQRAVVYCYATTRGPFTESNSPNARADASPAIRARFAQWLAERERISYVRHLTSVSPANYHSEAHHGNGSDPRHIGAAVRVFKGRKVPKGTEGRVLNISREIAHRSQYGTWTQYRDMLLIDTGAGTWRVDANNCELVDIGPRLTQEIFDLSEAA